MSRQLEEQAAVLYPVVSTTGRDTLAWAKRFVWRHQHGDKDLSHIQIQFSHQALGLDPKANKQ